MEEPSQTSSLFERLVTHRDLSLFVPFISGLSRTDPDQETATDRVVLINPLTQGLVVVEGASASTLEGLLRGVSGKQGQAPAAIEALPWVEAEGGEECAICLEEMEGGVKEMGCEHRFHGGCVERWLRVNGSCPLCRYKMPVDEPEVGKGRSVAFGGGEVWVSFSFSGLRRSVGSDQTAVTAGDGDGDGDGDDSSAD